MDELENDLRLSKSEQSSLLCPQTKNELFTQGNNISELILALHHAKLKKSKCLSEKKTFVE